MPKGSKTKNAAEASNHAMAVARIATDEEQEEFGPDIGKDKAAQELGRKGVAAAGYDALIGSWFSRTTAS